MQWPDYDVQNIADFEGWYQRALGLFFDEQHTIKEFDVNVERGWLAGGREGGGQLGGEVVDARSSQEQVSVDWMLHQTWQIVALAGRASR